MCVIAAKPAGVDMPIDQYIENMWTRNHDGAGIMYAVNDKVHIEKGFMKFEAFRERLDQLSDQYNLKDIPVVMHFRITTHGGTKPENCHPFPISDSVGVLSKLKQTAKIGVAHNGIIDITPRKGISDTMEYIISQLSPLSKAVPNFYENKHLMKMISNAIDSRMAFLTGKGDIYTIGSFVEEAGIMYSNTTYKNAGYLSTYKYAHGSMYLSDNWETLDDEDNYYYKNVMWLDDGQYVMSSFDANIRDGDLFAIDRNNNVYCYSNDYGAMVRAWRYTAYTSEGTPLRYDEKSPLITLEAIVW